MSSICFKCGHVCPCEKMFAMRNATECAERENMTTGWVHITAENIRAYIGIGERNARKISDKEAIKRAKKRGFSLIVDRVQTKRVYWVRKL